MSVEETVQAINTSEGNNVDTVLQAIGKLRSEEKDELVEMLYEKRLLISVYEKGNFSLAERLVNVLPPSIYEFEELAITQYLKDKPQDKETAGLLLQIKKNSFEAVEELEDEEQIPTQFTMGAQGALQDESGNAYQLGRALTGRGQPGLAAFYIDPNNKQLLIKEDKAGTCIAEGTAYFVKEAGLLPEHLSDAINFAQAGKLTKEDGTESVISVQERVMPSSEGGSVKPWDELIYGTKRNPKTLWSMESWKPEEINNNINGLNNDAQWSLAAAVFASVLAGDESLHVAQFMALVDNENHITGIKRIDLGARERYAQKRDETAQINPFQTSSQYQGKLLHGQLNKDYISYLLASPSLQRKYTLLWKDLKRRYPNDNALREVIMAGSKKAMREQFDNIPAEQKEPALKEFLKVVGLPETDGLFENRLEAAMNAIAQLDASRIAKMSEIAEQNIELSDQPLDEILSQTKEALLHNANVWRNNEFKVTLTNNPDFADAYKSMCKQCEAMIARLEDAYLQSNGSDKTLAIEIERYQTVIDALTYMGNTTDPTKRKMASDICINALQMEREFFKSSLEQIDPRAYQMLAEHQSPLGWAAMTGRAATGGSSAQTRGAAFFKSLCDRYHINDFDLKFKYPNALRLVQQDSIDNLCKDLNLMMSKKALTINDVTAQDKDGRTILHTLMEHASPQNSTHMKAIINVLNLSSGATYNTNLNIVDRKGETPLDLLMKNEQRALEMSQKINEAKLQKHLAWTGYSGYFYNNIYQFQDFFDLNIHNPKYKEALGIEVPENVIDQYYEVLKQANSPREQLQEILKRIAPAAQDEALGILFQKALSENQAVILRELLRLDSFPNILSNQNPQDETPLVTAIKHGFDESVAVLVQSGKPLGRTKQDHENGATALHYLMGYGAAEEFIPNSAMICSLLNNGAFTTDPGKVQNKEGDTLLHLLVAGNFMQTLYDIDRNCKSTALKTHASGIYAQLGSGLTVSNNDKMTPIMIAAFTGNVPMLRLLAGPNIMALSANALQAYESIAKEASTADALGSATLKIRSIVNDYQQKNQSWRSSGDLPGFDKSYLDQPAQKIENTTRKLFTPHLAQAREVGQRASNSNVINLSEVKSNRKPPSV